SVTDFFFFQAEDGIRDKLVTGVQTCALPICPLPSIFHLPGNANARARIELRLLNRRARKNHARGRRENLFWNYLRVRLPCPHRRSEERRVGKECRCWRVGSV